MKYEDRKENDKAADYFSILLEEYPNDYSEYHKKAKFFLAVYHFKNGDENVLIDYIKDNHNSQNHLDAYKEMVFYYIDTQQIEKELNLYNEILLKYSNNPKILNMYAWRMAEIEINLEDALAKAQKAIHLMNDDPKRANIIDTEAEIFWKMKQYDNAIRTIDLAIQIDPQNQYYKDQREKFLDSKIAASVDL